MKCNITKSPYYGKYCVKRKCDFYPCSQLLTSNRRTIGEVVLTKGERTI